MAMNMGGPGGPGDEPEVMVEINTTPLIDVMLVLLIMLIITIPIQLHAVNLNLPQGKPPKDVEPTVLQIDIDAKSVVHWQGLPVEGAADLDAKMRAAAALVPQPDVHLRPDKDSRYEVVAGVLASTRRLGLNRIAVLGGEQFEP